MPSIALASGATSSMLTICTVKHVSSTNSIPASNYLFHTLDDKPFELNSAHSMRKAKCSLFSNFKVQYLYLEVEYTAVF